MLRCCIAILGATLLPGCAAGQSWPTQLKPGTRIYVTVPGGTQVAPKAHTSTVIGKVDHLTVDSLYLRTVDSLGPLAIPRRLMHGLAVSHGFTSRGNSALRRGLIYGAVGIPYFALFNELNQDRRYSTKTAAIAGGAVGIVVGVIHGLVRPSERWEAIKLEPVMGTAPRSIGVTVALRW